MAGTAGDHPVIQQFLATLAPRSRPNDFQSQLDDPYYEPTDRLLVKRGEHLLAHAHLAQRTMQFGQADLPIVVVNDFATAPELRWEGVADALLSAAMRRIRKEPAAIGVLRTNQPAFFQSRGWCVCLRHSHSVANPRDILSQLEETKPAARFGEGEPPVNIRIWRHVELAALVRLYGELKPGRFGPLERSAAYWAWLISRRGYDRLYVATSGPDTGTLDDNQSPIVGYAVVRAHRILELMASPEFESAPRELLAAVCRDAIEQDRHLVQLDAAPDDALHRNLVRAGGTQNYYEAQAGEVSMVHVGNPMRLLRNLGQRIVRRARRRGMELPCELGLKLRSDRYLLRIGTRGIKVIPGKLGRSYLECEPDQLPQLLLGHCDAGAALSAGRIEASTRVAREMAAQLFPQLPIWRPPWDDESGH